MAVRGPASLVTRSGVDGSTCCRGGIGEASVNRTVTRAPSVRPRTPWTPAAESVRMAAVGRCLAEGCSASVSPRDAGEVETMSLADRHAQQARLVRQARKAVAAIRRAVEPASPG